MLDFQNKKYRLNNGSKYRNYCIDAGGNFPIHGAFRDRNYNWIPLVHNENGECLNDSTYDLVEINPYEGWKIDDLIEVRDKSSEAWQFRYFAGIDSEGRVKTWGDGRTSITAISPRDYKTWKEAIRYAR